MNSSLKLKKALGFKVRFLYNFVWLTMLFLFPNIYVFCTRGKVYPGLTIPLTLLYLVILVFQQLEEVRLLLEIELDYNKRQICYKYLSWNNQIYEDCLSMEEYFLEVKPIWLGYMASPNYKLQIVRKKDGKVIFKQKGGYSWSTDTIKDFGSALKVKN